MKVVIGFISFWVFLFSPNLLYAQQPSLVATSSSSINVQATVPGVNLTISGIAAPNASIVLMAPDGFVYKGGVADANGNFSLENVLVAKGLTKFCLESVDVARLGSSLACLPMKAVLNDIHVRDIFLPPTIGLQRQEIVEGTDAVVFGYSMPNAQVTIRLNTGQAFNVQTNTSGYYEYSVPDLGVGNYQMVAGAYYEAKPSLPSVRSALLKTISLGQAIENDPLPFIIPAIIIIAGVLAYVFRKRLLGLLLFKKQKRRLHHWWFVGY